MSRRIAVLAVAGATTATLAALPTAAQADSTRDQQWHLAFLNVEAAHRISDGTGVVVAVADTGIDVTHPDLAGAVIDGTEPGESGDGRRDSDGHGTAMAGLIAARGHGDGGRDGALGIAPKASLLAVRTLRSDFGGSPGDLAAGVEWAVDHGAKVICVAGETGDVPEVRKAIEGAIRADVVVVAAVGNLPNDTTVAFPARLPGVLAVGGVDKNGNHASISATGPEVALSAPAVDILSTDAYRKYRTGTGTSDATAIVAGAAALVRAKYPNLRAPEVIHRLTATATDKGPPGRDPQYGYGIVNLVAALTANVPPATTAPPAAAGSNPPQAATTKNVSAAGLLIAVGAAIALTVVVVLIRRRYRRISGPTS
jgi:type VII secretion-associated serine protease mycosin